MWQRRQPIIQKASKHYAKEYPNFRLELRCSDRLELATPWARSGKAAGVAGRHDGKTEGQDPERSVLRGRTL
ncbi:hypothetical protein E2C01_069427 [Portunus trituberculatus]|uniref:Uncharacterized protein n=1 Tax=Portunus trituberculatus TaxID=210409 RepID=A0A5B7HYI4_PORTR|nr:hypothetical protein [Portunus trituberculatus]